MSSELDELKQKLDQIHSAVVSPDAKMMDVKDIQIHFKYKSIKSARRLIADPSFPPPMREVKYQDGDTTRLVQPRWFSDEVEQWARGR